jgi:hypothetical protein
MPIIFYDHLIDKQDIILFIEKSDAPDNQKGKLKQLVDDVLHQGLVKFVLSKLHTKHHRVFLDQLHHAPYNPEIIDYLKEKVAHDIEEKIRAEADLLIKKVRKDLGLK